MMQRLFASRFGLASLPILGYVLWLPELAGGQPNVIWAGALLLWACLCAALAAWAVSSNAQPAMRWLEFRASQIVWLLIAVSGAISVSLTLLQALHFSPGVYAEDTAYYGQVLWNTLHGNFLAGNVQQEHLYDPPVSNDLAIHVAPILFVLLPFYAVLPDPLVLLIFRDLAVCIAAWPLFLIARDRLGPVGGIAATVLYLSNPAVNAQSVSAFYLLQFAPLPFFYVLKAFIERNFRAFLIWAAIALAVREDVSITLAGFGVVALLRRYPRRWIVTGLTVPVIWWIVTTMLIQPAFGRVGNARFDSTLAGGEEGLVGAYRVLIGEPTWLLEVLTASGPAYLFRLLGWAAYVSVLGLESLLAGPAVLAHLFLSRVQTVGLDVYSRFALLPECALIGAAVIVSGRLIDRMGMATKPLPLILLLLLPSVTLLDGNKDLVQRVLAVMILDQDERELRAGLEEIPPRASVAAPQYLLPSLSNREQLYLLENFADYPNADPAYFFLDHNTERLWVNEQKRQAYLLLVETLRSSGRYESVWQGADYEILRRASGSAVRLPADR